MFHFFICFGVCFWTCSLTFHTLQQVCLYFIYKFKLFDMVKLSDKFLSFFPFLSSPHYHPAPGKLKKIFLPAFILTEPSQVSMCSRVAMLGLLLWIPYPSFLVWTPYFWSPCHCFSWFGEVYLPLFTAEGYVDDFVTWDLTCLRVSFFQSLSWVLYGILE